MEFTIAQKQAIELKNRNILVSAAAGSGKTATLTERIIRLLIDKENPADISSMLIVTFTRAAAGELRTRISKALTNALADDPSNKHIAAQLTSLGGAKICTIDAYYLDLIRSNFQRLDLPARFRLADESELALLREEIMNSVIERRYEFDSDFISYADQLTTAKGENMLSESLLELASKVMSTPQGTDFLAECASEYADNSDKDYFDTKIGKVMLKSLKCELLYLLKRCDRMISLIDSNENASPYGRAVSSDRDFIYSFANLLNCGNYSDARAMLYDYSPIALGRVLGSNKTEVTEEIKNERNEIKDRIVSLREREFFAHPDDISKMCQISSAFCIKTKEILDDYFAAYNDEKSSRNICEFSDLRKYALKLLIDEDGEPTPLAKDEQGKFKHIFVDEYQDTDKIQDLVFRAISNGHNLFFVGDIKQSIYSFRGAEPSVFAAYRKEYLPAEGRDHIPDIPLSVFMSENFRCSPNIISFTNAVCSYLFRECEGDGYGIGYIAEDDLISSRAEPVSEEKIKIILLEKSSDQPCENIEADYVITEINKLLGSGTRPDGSKFKPRDIAILTRSNKEAMSIADALARAGIPHANSTGNDLFENREVLLMLALLSTADNPQRDIPLAGSLRSPIFGFTMSELVNIRHGRSNLSLYDSIQDYINDPECDPVLRDKCALAVDKIENYRSEAESMPVHLFMRYIWKDINALSYAGSDEQTKKRTPIERRRNLRKFYEYARKFEASSFKGLHEFIEYINGIIARGTKITDEDAVTDNTVRIMTVHKSKGLEFPVVFLVGCDKQPNEQDSKKSVVFMNVSDLGLACKVSDSTGLAQLDTPFRIAISNRLSEISSEEEIRILYVALTRARDILYVVASGKEGFAEKRLADAIRKASIGGRNTIFDSPKWLERILIALAADETNRSYTIETPIITRANSDDEENTEVHISEEDVIEICDSLRPYLNYKYPYNSISDIPAKVSVSKLYPELLNEEKDYSGLLIKAESFEARKPRFLGGGNDAAEKGTATHLFLQFCDYSKLLPNEDSVNEEISRLVSQKFITNDIADLIRVDEIVRFVKSDLMHQLCIAKEIHREFRFNIILPAANFTTEAHRKDTLNDEEILVQGVIDLCFVDSTGKLILCDYKTDRIPSEMYKDREALKQHLSHKHGKQLEYYSYAIESIMGRSPDKIYIYALALGDWIEINI